MAWHSRALIVQNLYTTVLLALPPRSINEQKKLNLKKKTDWLVEYWIVVSWLLITDKIRRFISPGFTLFNWNFFQILENDLSWASRHCHSPLRFNVASKVWRETLELALNTEQLNHGHRCFSPCQTWCLAFEANQ